MRRAFTLAAVMFATSCNLGVHPGGTAPSTSTGGGTGSIANDQATFDRFAVMDVKLGAPVASLAGFSPCAPDAPFRYPAVYYKWLDAQCKSATCALDPHDHACGFTVNGTPRELDAIRVTVTDTPDHRVYEIKYEFPREMLSETSALGKSLVAKYGPHCELATCYTAPSDSTTADSVGGGDMQWANTGHMPQSFSDNPRIDVNCFPSGGYPEGITKKCHLTVASDTILDAERAKAH